MALRGTLKDFGIADIFQLIGHQGKTGTLTVSEKNRDVKIHFVDGNVVSASTTTRKEKHLLGRMLVRAEVITEGQLSEALALQRSSGRRIGDILVDGGLIDREALAAFFRLQSYETIYQLFLWTSGTYEFRNEDIVAEPGQEHIRSESILMEGFRQVDEWPSLRRKLSSYSLRFVVVDDLEALMNAQEADGPKVAEDDDLDLDAAFGDFSDETPTGSDPRLKDIGEKEVRVFRLVTPDRDVQKIIDLARLGEFETCKALVTLVENGFLYISEQASDSKSVGSALVGGAIHAHRVPGLGGTVARLFVLLALVAGGVYWAKAFGVSADGNTRGGPWTEGYQAQALRSELGTAARHRLERALDVYRTMHGSYPDSLQALVDSALLEPRDLRFPWRDNYFYSVSGDAYELLRPIF